MGLLDGLEKLINEHGSATILKERIALANDKYSALEKEFAASLLRTETAETRVSNLEAENQSLKLDNEKLRQEIQRRNDESDKEKFHGNLLEQIKTDILLYMSKYEETYVQPLANALKIGSQTALSHLEDLSELDMVDHSIIFGGGENHWYLRKEGRKYLVKNNLIQ